MDFTYGYIFGPIYRFHGIFGCLKGREVFSKTKKLVIKYRFIPVAVIMTQLFFKWANPGFFFHSSPSFQTNNTFFTTNQCEKMSIRSSKRCWDLIPRPLEHESLLITTRPGLLPQRPNSWNILFSMGLRTKAEIFVCVLKM